MPTDETYERIGRRLDGEDVRLAAPEQAVADEILRDEPLLRRLDVPADRQAIDRARRRALAALARPGPLRRVAGWAALAAAAALLLFALLPAVRGPKADPRAVAGATSFSPEEAALQLSPRSEELELLAWQVDELAAQVAEPTASANLQDNLDALQNEIDNFWVLDLAPKDS